MKEQIKIVFVTDSKTTNELFLMPSAYNKFEMHSVDTDGVVEMRQVIECNEVAEEPQTKEVGWEGEYQLENGSGWFKYRHTYIASNGDMFAICLVPNANNGNPFEQYLDVATTKFRALETEAKKLEREELESAYDLYCTQCESQGVEPLLISTFTECGLLKPWVAIVRKTGYRKGE